MASKFNDNFNDALDKVGTVSETINAAAKDAKIIAKIVSPTSITRLAQDSIFQFPMIISASIDTDEIFTMAKYAEKNYAALMASVVSLYGYVNLSKYGSIAEYLKKFHQNGNIGGIISLEGTEDAPVSNLESATLIADESVVGVAVSDLWDNVVESLDTQSLNDMYQPYKQTEVILKNALKLAKDTIANEANGSSTGGKLADALTANREAETEVYHQRENNHLSAKPSPNAIVRDDKLSNMQPTMVNLQFVVDAGKDRAHWMQNVVIGIKAMVRMVKSSNMVVNMGEACKDRAIFKFVGWTKGEKSTASIIMNTGEIAEGHKSLDTKNHWILVLKRRKKAAKGLINTLLGRRLMPNTTVIMTEQEVMAIKDQYGVDLSSPANAIKVMSKYFMLGIGIYDTESKVLDIIYDGESEFSSMSLRMLVAEAKKETNLLAMNKY